MPETTVARKDTAMDDMTAMDVDALRELRNVMERIRTTPEQHFRFTTWLYNDRGDVNPTTEAEAIHCGTHACVAGWWALSPEGQARGWSVGVHGTLWRDGVELQRRYNDDGFERSVPFAMADLVRLPPRFVEDLIVNGYLYYALRDPTDQVWSRRDYTVTPDLVIRAIDAIIAGRVGWTDDHRITLDDQLVEEA